MHVQLTPGQHAGGMTEFAALDVVLAKLERAITSAQVVRAVVEGGRIAAVRRPERGRKLTTYDPVYVTE